MSKEKQEGRRGRRSDDRGDPLVMHRALESSEMTDISVKNAEKVGI